MNFQQWQANATKYTAIVPLQKQVNKFFALKNNDLKYQKKKKEWLEIFKKIKDSEKNFKEVNDKYLNILNEKNYNRVHKDKYGSTYENFLFGLNAFDKHYNKQHKNYSTGIKINKQSLLVINRTEIVNNLNEKTAQEKDIFRIAIKNQHLNFKYHFYDDYQNQKCKSYKINYEIAYAVLLVQELKNKINAIFNYQMRMGNFDFKKVNRYLEWLNTKIENILNNRELLNQLAYTSLTPTFADIKNLIT